MQIRWRQQGINFDDVVGRPISDQQCKPMEESLAFYQGLSCRCRKRIATANNEVQRLFHDQVARD